MMASYWRTWCTDGTSTSSTVTTDNSIGYTWAVDGGSTTDMTSNSTVWIQWSKNYELTAEEKATQEARLEQQRIEAEERRLQKEEAEQRAEILLRSQLTPEQQRQLDEMSAFIVNNEMRTYKIGRGRARNIRELDKNGREVAVLCAHPIDNVPDADTMLVQKIMLEHAEAEFLRVANRSPI